MQDIVEVKVLILIEKKHSTYQKCQKLIRISSKLLAEFMMRQIKVFYGAGKLLVIFLLKRLLLGF